MRKKFNIYTIILSIFFIGCFSLVSLQTFSQNNITHAQSPLQITSFSATPASVEKGKPITLKWTTNNSMANCSISAPGTVGILNIRTGGIIVSPTLNTQYTLTCNAPTGRAIRPINVTVLLPSPKITSFTATPPTIIRGSSTTLRWATTNTSKCFSIKNLPTDILFGAGTNTTARPIDLNNSTGISISPTASSRYVIACGDNTLNPLVGFTLNSTNTMTALTVAVTPPPPPQITSLVATPASVITGGFTKLTWTSTNSTSCTLQGATVTTSNSTGIYFGPLTTNTNYVLSCTGPGGTANQVRAVTVTPVPATACKYINLTLNESKPATPANSPVSITLTSQSATGEEIGSAVFPYSAEWSPDYVLKTLRANGTVIGSYNLFSGRFINLENFTTPSLSQMIEVPQASLDAVIPFSLEIRSIQIDSKPAIPLNASTMTCPQFCRIAGQSVVFPDQKCCSGLSVKSINNTFVCSI